MNLTYRLPKHSMFQIACSFFIAYIIPKKLSTSKALCNIK